MTRRQTDPEEWLIIDRPDISAIRSLPRGSGVFLLVPLEPAELRMLRHVARSRQLTIVVEAPRSAARVHDVRELARALLRRSPRILLSPIYPTRSHPGWRPLPRMRAAALARLAGRRAIALGGMNRRRFRKVAPLGFTGWAGITAFRT
jgi:thiamine-phosphate pyrophosphorylase